MITEWLTGLGAAITTNLWLAPLLALLAGVLTSFTPCALSSVPLVIGYVGGAANNDPKIAFRFSLIFCLGMTLTFTALGTVASIAGKLLQGSGSWWYIALGLLMVLMALQTWDVFTFTPQNLGIQKNPKRGYVGAFLAGILGGFFSSPCATPVLVVLLALVAEQGNILWGIFLLLLYSAGHSILVLAAGTSIGFVQKVSASSKYKRYNQTVKILLGLAMLLLAFYMFYLGF